MASYTLSPIGGAGSQFFDNSGNVLSGGKLYAYLAGTTTPAPTYTTPAGITANSNPIVFNSAGRPANEIWLAAIYVYKFVLKDANDVLIATYDNIPGLPQPPIVNDASSISYEPNILVNAGSFVVGQTYMIASLGDTNFTAVGAVYNSTGIIFTATGVGSGTGTAYVSTTVQTRLRAYEADGGSDYIGFLQSGTGAITTQTVQDKLRETVSVKDFGAIGDGVTDDTDAIQAAIDAVLTSNNLGRAGGKYLLFPNGTYLTNSSLVIDTGNIKILGDGSTISYSGSGTALTIGNVAYLTDLTAGYYVASINDLAFNCTNSSATGIQNLGYRKLEFFNLYVYGGTYGLISEGCFNNGLIQESSFQNQSSRAVWLRQRNNTLTLRNGSCLGVSAGVGVYIDADTAENSGILLDTWDCEGCLTGYQISGSNIGPITLLNCWGENNTTGVYVDTSTASVKNSISILGGNFDSNINYGASGDPGIVRGCIISDVKMINADIRINTTEGVQVGINSYTGTSALYFASQGLATAGLQTSAELMPRYTTNVGVPYDYSDTRGQIGDLRWDNGRGYIKNSATSWRMFQVSKFADSQVNGFIGTTLDASGMFVVRTANSGSTTVTSITNGFPGQQLIIIGSDGGNTTISSSAAKLPGGTPITLGDNDVLHLVCLQNVAPIWVCVSHSDNPV